MCPAEELEGNLRLVDAGSADEQSAVADEVAFRSATDRQQAYPALLGLFGGLGDVVPGPLDSGSESSGAGTSLVDEFRIKLGVCRFKGVQDETLGLQMPRHWAEDRSVVGPHSRSVPRRS